MKITATITREGEVVHSETRRAFNAGIRGSEAAVRNIARAVGCMYEGSRPAREGEIYTRQWTSPLGDHLTATIIRSAA